MEFPCSSPPSRPLRARRAIVPALAGACLLAACEGLSRRESPPAESLVTAESTSVDPPAARRARPAEVPASRDYPSAAEVADGPIGLRPVDSPPPRPVPPARSTAPRLDLENLATAQEQHFANNARYASNLSYLTLRLVPRPGVTVRIESASDSGWTGRSTLDGWTGSSCVVWVGRVGTRPATDRHQLTPARPGRVVCDSL